MKPSSGIGTRVLIVDDEHANVNALCDTLGAQGYETRGTTEPREALATLENEAFDVLLTDLMMPGVDGIGVLRAAQQIQPALIGILMTGHATVDTAVEAMKVGAIDYIMKPIKLSALLPVMTRGLALRNLRRENEALQVRLKARAEELEIANADLAAFSFSVTHDLMAPVRAINGYSRILQEETASALEAQHQRHLGHIVTSGGRMERIITDLLRLATLGKKPLETENIEIRPMVQEVVEDLRVQRPEQRAIVRVGDLPPCQGDPGLLRHVFVNLISNALKFSAKSEAPTVDIEGRAGATDLTYEVRDNGVGFDSQRSDRLFRVFSRLHRGDEFEGTGIGLSIVRRIIERHRGSVWAESTPGQGARFSFSLPAENTPTLILPG